MNKQRSKQRACGTSKKPIRLSHKKRLWDLPVKEDATFKEKVAAVNKMFNQIFGRGDPSEDEIAQWKAERSISEEAEA